MTFDHAKLSPLPLTIKLVYDDGELDAAYIRDASPRAVGSFYSEHDAAFYVASRRAFDVRMRRKWRSEWIRHTQEFVATDEYGECIDYRQFRSADPDSCLIAADEWMTANEGKVTT